MSYSKNSVLLACVMAALVACSGDSSAVVENPGAAGWTRLPAGTIGPRESAHGFWIDPEVLIVGGSDAPPCPPGADCVAPAVASLRDGARLNPASGEWRDISPAPQPIGAASGVVINGVVYLWVHGFEGRPGTQRDFLAYHVDEDEWDQLALPQPVPDSVNLGSVGQQLVAYQHTQENGVEGDFLFDPDTATWTELPADPLRPAFDRSMVWTGTGLVLLAIELDSPGGPNFYSAAVFDLATATWTRLPDSEIIGWSPTWYPAGDDIVNPSVGSADGGEVDNWGRSYSFGGVLDPAAPAWEPLPHQPARDAEFSGYTAASDDLLLGYEGWLLDYPNRTWTAPPIPPDGHPHGATVVATNDSLIVWGGVIWEGSHGRLLDTGWEYQLGN